MSCFFLFPNFSLNFLSFLIENHTIFIDCTTIRLETNNQFEEFILIIWNDRWSNNWFQQFTRNCFHICFIFPIRFKHLVRVIRVFKIERDIFFKENFESTMWNYYYSDIWWNFERMFEEKYNFKPSFLACVKSIVGLFLNI